MDREWNDNQPIYRQLRDRVVAMILDGVLKEGDPLPSVRNVAAEYRVNPLTVLKGYQELEGERQKFLSEEWPRISATIQRLGLKAEELLNGANKQHQAESAKPRPNESKTPDSGKEDR